MFAADLVAEEVELRAQTELDLEDKTHRLDPEPILRRLVARDLHWGCVVA